MMQNMFKTAIGIGGLIIVLALQHYASSGPDANAGPKPYRNSNDTAGSAGNTKTYRRDRAGDFDYYALVMSWSPTYCLGEGAGRDEPQCSRQRPYAFVLHGLWPQYESGYPDSCDAGKAWVDQTTIASMMDIMPSRGLIIHEYKKHGTCSGLGADGYFKMARKLYSSIVMPAAYKSANSEIVTSPSRLVSDILKANPQLKPDGLAVDCGASRGRLREIRFCFSRDGQPRSCGKNENRSRMCGSDTVTLPAARG
jgi:ribonuclease T2